MSTASSAVCEESDRVKTRRRKGSKGREKGRKKEREDVDVGVKD